MNIPRMDKDGWFTRQFGEKPNETCHPPIGRVVEIGASNAGAIEKTGEAHFDGNGWIYNGNTIGAPEFWRIKR